MPPSGFLRRFAMRNLFFFLLTLAVTLSGTLARAGEPQPKITVSGEAVVKVSPDRGVVTLGIETMDPNLEKAKSSNDRILQLAIKAITSCCVDLKEIQTAHLSIAPRYRDSNRRTPEDFLGYFVNNAFAVTLNDPAKIEQLLTVALQAGVTNIDNLSFETTEFKKYREQARELALQAAREKAEKMAAVLGARVGAPLQVTEGGRRLGLLLRLARRRGWHVPECHAERRGGLRRTLLLCRSRTDQHPRLRLRHVRPDELTRAASLCALCVLCGESLLFFLWLVPPPLAPLQLG